MSENQTELRKPVDDISVRTILVWIFGVWGVVGLIFSLVNYSSAMQATSIGVGTTAYLMVGLLLWIGGMVLFGVGALIAKVPDPSNVRLQVPYAPPPLPLQEAGGNPYDAGSSYGGAWVRGAADREKKNPT